MADQFACLFIFRLWVLPVSGVCCCSRDDISVWDALKLIGRGCIESSNGLQIQNAKEGLLAQKRVEGYTKKLGGGVGHNNGGEGLPDFSLPLTRLFSLYIVQFCGRGKTAFHSPPHPPPHPLHSLVVSSGEGGGYGSVVTYWKGTWNFIQSNKFHLLLGKQYHDKRYSCLK